MIARNATVLGTAVTVVCCDTCILKYQYMLLCWTYYTGIVVLIWHPELIVLGLLFSVSCAEIVARLLWQVNCAGSEIVTYSWDCLCWDCLCWVCHAKIVCAEIVYAGIVWLRLFVLRFFVVRLVVVILFVLGLIVLRLFLLKMLCWIAVLRLLVLRLLVLILFVLSLSCWGCRAEVAVLFTNHNLNKVTHNYWQWQSNQWWEFIILNNLNKEWSLYKITKNPHLWNEVQIDCDQSKIMAKNVARTGILMINFTK